MNQKVYVFTDGIGRVELLQHMGTDIDITAAARISYSNRRSITDDMALLQYLMRHRHTSPFEMVEFKFHVVAPIFVARQWLRHRTASVNEQSARYSVLQDRFYFPAVESICAQSQVNKQGRDFAQPCSNAMVFLEDLKHVCGLAYEAYESACQAGIAREIARMLLPNNIYTEFIWKQNLHNLLHFLELRMDEHAQYEIRLYAEAIYGLIAPIVPLTIGAFELYRLNALTLSAHEIAALRTNQPLASTSKTEQAEWQTKLKLLQNQEEDDETEEEQPK